MATPDDLFSAVDHPSALRALITAGHDVEVRDAEWGCTPLFHAVLVGNMESVGILIDAGCNVNAVAGELGSVVLAYSPLSLAMQCRHLLDSELYDPVVKRLEAAGAVLVEEPLA